MQSLRGCACVSACVRACVWAEYYSSWRAVTSVAIIESRSAQGIDCSHATHTCSLIIWNHTRLSSLATLVPSPFSYAHPSFFQLAHPHQRASSALCMSIKDCYVHRISEVNELLNSHRELLMLLSCQVSGRPCFWWIFTMWPFLFFSSRGLRSASTPLEGNGLELNLLYRSWYSYLQKVTYN